MKKPFLSYILSLIALFCLVACNDDMALESDGADNQNGCSYWHSPEVLTRAQTRNYFLRDHAVGYSYEAVSGHANSLDDVRCQVVNRAVLDYIAEYELMQLYVADLHNTVYSKEMVYNSFTQYVQNSNFHATAEGQIVVVASGDLKRNCSIFEDGTLETRMVQVSKRISCGEYALQYGSLLEMAKRYPMILTASFRNAVQQVADAPNENFVACVDSFLATYGTHVVTKAEFGGSVDILVQIEKKKYNTVYGDENNLTVDVLEGLFKKAGQGSESEKKYKYLENAKCNITVRGGDVSMLDALNNMNYYGVNASDSISLYDWMNSVTFDPDNSQKTTATVISMEYVPIYEFVTNEKARERIEAVIDGSTETMIKTFGNRNFVNVKIPYNAQDIIYRLGNHTTLNCTAPDVTDFVYAGRHVATICKERIKEIDPDFDVRVVYPIYEGRMQQTDGVCLSGGHEYHVKWTDNDKCEVTDNGTASTDGYVYILAGVPSFTAYKNISYYTAHAIPGAEVDTPFSVDGTYNPACKLYYVEKKRNNFYLKDCDETEITSIPNWTYDKDLKRMRRSDDYIYIYNPNELDYYD